MSENPSQVIRLTSRLMGLTLPSLVRFRNRDRGQERSSDQANSTASREASETCVGAVVKGRRPRQGPVEPVAGSQRWNTAGELGSKQIDRRGTPPTREVQDKRLSQSPLGGNGQWDQDDWSRRTTDGHAVKWLQNLQDVSPCCVTPRIELCPDEGQEPLSFCRCKPQPWSDAGVGDNS